MASKLLNNFQEPLIIDIGSDRVKFAQPLINTQHVTKMLKTKGIFSNDSKIFPHKSQNKIIESDSVLVNNMEDYGINANSVFDTDIFMESFPSLLSRLDLDNNLENFTRYKEHISQGKFTEILSLPEYEDCHNVNVTIITESPPLYDLDKINTPLYGYEPSYSGIIQDTQFEQFHNIFERVGEIHFKKSNFLSHYLTETPLIITQKALPFNLLQKQLKKIYEIAFEEYKTPFLLVCSTAMLNLFSHNLSSGIVVDIGESSTNITAVVDGFTQYETSINSEYLSGRNVTYSMATFENLDNNLIQNFVNDKSCSEISFEQYLQTKYNKEQNNLKYIHKKYEEGSNDHNNKDLYMGNFFSYPELFKYMFSDKKLQKYSNKDKFKLRRQELARDLDELVKYTGISYSDLTKFGNTTSSEFHENYIFPYLTTENTLENRVSLGESNFVNKHLLKCFRQFSLPHLILYEIEKMINSDILNVNKYLNIVFAGGIFNSPGFSEFIEKEFQQMIIHSNFDNKKYIKLFFPNKNSDSGFSISKGINYISRLNNLNELMISIFDYYNLGKECLCYNYI